MCGMILMSLGLPPPSPPSSSSISSSRSARSTGDHLLGYHIPASASISPPLPPPEKLRPYLPATEAVNDLLLRTTTNDSVKRMMKAEAEADDGSSSLKRNKSVDNLHDATKTTTWDFPTIEWSISSEENEEDDDDYDDDDNFVMETTGLISVKSAPARFHHHEQLASSINLKGCPRRGSLVRSISLVSSIMKEMKKRPSNATKDFLLSSSSKKKKHNKKLKSLHKKKGHHKRRPHGHSKDIHSSSTSASELESYRLIALKHSTTTFAPVSGLQVGHHEESQKFFL